MAFCRLVFPLLVLSVISCYASKVPVYMWGDLPRTSTKANPLTTVHTPEFNSILKQELQEDPLTIVFVEETLSVDDLSEKNSNGETSYPYLHENINEALYLPSVDHPLHILNKKAEGSKIKIELTENGLSEEIPSESSEIGNFIFIALKDAREDESRFNLLRRHDEFMQNTVSDMSKYHDKVVAIYTGHNPSWTVPKTYSHSRVRRATTRNDTSLVINGLRFNIKGISLKSSNDTAPLSAVTSSSSTFNATELSATLNFENDTSVVLHFNLFRGYWFFNTVTLTVGSLTEELLPSGDEVYAIEGFSYRCSESIRFASINQTRDYTVIFSDLKVQPFFRDTNATEKFGDSFNCVGFFTAPIWAGLFVVFILLIITFYGIMMMMDIRTMDRFDDAKGKTITINAAE